MNTGLWMLVMIPSAFVLWSFVLALIDCVKNKSVEKYGAVPEKTRKIVSFVVCSAILATGFAFGYGFGVGSQSRIASPDTVASKPKATARMVSATYRPSVKATPRPTVRATTSTKLSDGFDNLEALVLQPDVAAALHLSSNSSNASDLSVGDRGEDVRQAQIYLAKMGYAVGSADGVFGQKTEAAVRAYQRDHGFDVTGTIAPEVMYAMKRDARYAGQSTSSSSSSSYGSSSYSTTGSTTYVWITRTGSRYHRTNNCGNTNSATASLITKSEAIQRGYSACGNCY